MCRLVCSSGVSRVVIAARDNNPDVCGGGIEEISRAGICVDVGCEKRAARTLNRGWHFSIEEKRPYVMYKLALDANGAISVSSGRESKWISSEISRKIVHRLRAGMDVILTGRGTVDR